MNETIDTIRLRIIFLFCSELINLDKNNLDNVRGIIEKLIIWTISVTSSYCGKKSEIIYGLRILPTNAIIIEKSNVNFFNFVVEIPLSHWE